MVVVGVGAGGFCRLGGFMRTVGSYGFFPSGIHPDKATIIRSALTSFIRNLLSVVDKAKPKYLVLVLRLLYLPVAHLVVDLLCIGTSTLCRTQCVDQLCCSVCCERRYDDDCERVFVPLLLDLVLPHDFAFRFGLII